MTTPEESSADMLAQLRSLSHRMSNALEVIMQAHYLLQRSRESFPETSKEISPQRKVLKQNSPELHSESQNADQNANQNEIQKWTTMIGSAAEEAAEANREIRDTIRRLSAPQTAEANRSLTFTSRRTKKTTGPLG